MFRCMLLFYWPRSLVARTLHVLFYVFQVLAFSFAIAVAKTIPDGSFFVDVIAFLMCLTPGYVLFWLPAVLVDRWEESHDPR